MVALCTLLVFSPVWGIVGDRIGAHVTYPLYAGGVLLLTWPLLALLAQDGYPSTTFTAAVLLGVLGGGNSAAAHLALHLFPSSVRTTAFGISFQLASCLAGAPVPFFASAVFSATGGQGWHAFAAPACLASFSALVGLAA